MSDPLLRCRGLVKHFPTSHRDQVVAAVNDVSFDIGVGETFALVGESGSGKTTIGRMILHTVAPTAGSISFAGEPVSELTDAQFRTFRHRIQAVFQDPYDSLNPRKTVRDIVLEPVRRLLDLDAGDENDRLDELLTKVQLPPDVAERRPHELGGGAQQKVSIARAIATDPELVVLDEPTSALDTVARAEIIALLGRLQADTGMSYLFITHDLTIVRHFAQRVGIMYLGKIVEQGPSGRIFDLPLHPYARALIQAVPFPEPERTHQLTTLHGEIPSPMNLPPGCFFASRCPIAEDYCTDEHPPLEPDEPDHVVACYRTDVMHALPVDRPITAAAEEYATEGTQQ